MQQNFSSTSRQTSSFWDLVKAAFKGSESGAKFPWLQSGIFLLGVAVGVFVTAGVELYLGIIPSGDSSEAEMSEAEKCREQGGRYDEGSETCLLVTSDIGASCSANSDCQGWCLADENDEVGVEKEGVCSESYCPKGCFKFIDEGVVNGICMP